MWFLVSCVAIEDLLRWVRVARADMSAIEDLRVAWGDPDDGQILKSKHDVKQSGSNARENQRRISSEHIWYQSSREQGTDLEMSI